MTAMIRSLSQLADDIRAAGLSLAEWPETGECGVMINGRVVIKERTPTIRLVSDGESLGEMCAPMVMGRESQRFVAELLSLTPEERRSFGVDPDSIDEQLRRVADLTKWMAIGEIPRVTAPPRPAPERKPVAGWVERDGGWRLDVGLMSAVVEASTWPGADAPFDGRVFIENGSGKTVLIVADVEGESLDASKIDAEDAMIGELKSAAKALGCEVRRG